LLKAWKGDEAGNLFFKGTARNFNPVKCVVLQDNGGRSRRTSNLRVTLDPNQFQCNAGIFCSKRNFSRKKL